MSEPPSELGLRRLSAAAQIAWDNQHSILVRFSKRPSGWRILVRQQRRNGNIIEQEGSDADSVMKMMEGFLLQIGSAMTGKSVDFLRMLVDKAVEPPMPAYR